jgi:predicted DNA-binding ribbon-helix-helix protein
MSQREIRAEDSVEELVERYPDLVGFLMDRGVVCVKCGEPFWGSLRELVSSKGLDVDAIVAEINARFAREG